MAVLKVKTDIITSITVSPIFIVSFYVTVWGHIVDLSNRQPVIINTYTINISRNFGGLQDGHRSNSVLKTCVLKQLNYYKCGKNISILVYMR
jgi:hypothetical protein